MTQKANAQEPEARYGSHLSMPLTITFDLNITAGEDEQPAGVAYEFVRPSSASARSLHLIDALLPTSEVKKFPDLEVRMTYLALRSAISYGATRAMRRVDEACGARLRATDYYGTEWECLGPGQWRPTDDVDYQPETWEEIDFDFGPLVIHYEPLRKDNHA